MQQKEPLSLTLSPLAWGEGTRRTFPRPVTIQ
jgi:hypothetical protein